MNESLTDFVTELAGSDITVLEEIIDKKYLKFKKFFELMRGYKDDIKSLKYEFSDSEKLDISIALKKKITLDDKKDLIEKWKEAGYQIKSEIKDQKMKLTIKYKEKD